jgi:hypothetical protein
MQLILWGMSTGKGDESMEFDLNAYQWSNRVVILFAESEKSPHFAEQRQILRDEKDGVLDRDLVVVEVLETGNSRSGGTKLSDAGAENLRTRFQAEAGAFLFILLGKDGGVKLRSAKPVSAEKLFSIIDAMPMRQQEMRRKK